MLRPQAVAEAAAGAVRLAELRTEMVAGLTSVGAEVVDGRAPFVLFRRPDAELDSKALCRTRGLPSVAVIRSSGLDERYLRAAVRPEWPVLVEAMSEVLR